MKDQIKGGLADKKKPGDFSSSALAKGRKVESEHTSSKSIATEIAMDHLTEDPNYYDKLQKMEKSAFWGGFNKQAGLFSAIGRASVVAPRMLQSAGKAVGRAGQAVESAATHAGQSAYSKMTGATQKAKSLPGQFKGHVVSEFEKGKLQQRLKDVPERSLTVVPGQKATPAASTREARRAALNKVKPGGPPILLGGPKATKASVPNAAKPAPAAAVASHTQQAPSKTEGSKPINWGAVGKGAAKAVGAGAVGYGIARATSGNKKQPEAEATA